jgi:hypothetical protein
MYTKFAERKRGAVLIITSLGSPRKKEEQKMGTIEEML